MYAIPKADVLYDIGPGLGQQKRPLNSAERAEMVDRHEMFVEEMTKATVAGNLGETTWGAPIDEQRPRDFPISQVSRNASRSADVRKALDDVEMAKGVADSQWSGARSEILSKEWTLTSPVATGLIPYDLEAPAKLLTPRPTPLRNSIPRTKGQGGSRRFKVISGFTGTGTGGATTVQPGINESSTNAGPGGLSYIRGPYINYDGSIGSAA
jgi:hypothetical protein